MGGPQEVGSRPRWGCLRIVPRAAGDFQRLDEAGADLVADLRFCWKVTRLCKKPRMMTALLAELGALRGIRTTIDLALDRYLDLDEAALDVADIDHFPRPPIHQVEQ